MSEREADGIPASVHDAAEDWLARQEGGLDPAGERKFAVWLAADPVHRRAYSEAKETWQDSGLLAHSQVGRARRLPRAPFYMRRSTHVGAAGLAVAALVGVVTLGVVGRSSPFALVTPAEAATYQTSLGEIHTFTLADGSRVTLDTATVLRVHFDAARRQIEVSRGRARFEVAADPRPFMVAVAGTNVTAHGRVFDVSIAEGTPRVAVFDGTVAWPDHTADGLRTLVAGQQTAPEASAASEAITPAETRWASGMLALDATPLGEALAAINRYNAVQIRVADPALSALKVTGAFRVRDPDGFARAVAAMFGLSAGRDGATITLAQRTGSTSTNP